MQFWTEIKESDKKKIITLFSVVSVAIVAIFSAGFFVSNNLVNAETTAVLSKADENKPVMVRKVATEPTESTEPPTESLPTVIKLKEETIFLKVGKEYKIELDKNLKLSFTSDVTTIAKVDEKGVVTGVSEGTALITCIDTKSKASAKLKVIVSEPIYPDKIELDKSFFTMTDIGELLKLTATLTPATGITETDVVWMSSDESVATVGNGLVKSVGEGVATITAYTANELSAICEIYVEPTIKCQELYLDYIAYDFTGPQTESVLLTPTVYPLNATNKAVKWYTTNSNVAVVDENGNVTIVGDGSCNIVCSTTDGTYLSVECDITATDTMVEPTTQGESSVYVPVNPIVADTVIEEAYRYVGVIPYVWGGTDLATGVDCSGFICAVYQRFGINLWGVRTDLYLAGTEVASIEEAKAGDILCYEGHVAIYDGNGGRVHAYDEGYMIMHDYNIDGYYTIRRIIE